MTDVDEIDRLLAGEDMLDLASNTLVWNDAEAWADWESSHTRLREQVRGLRAAGHVSGRAAGLTEALTAVVSLRDGTPRDFSDPYRGALTDVARAIRALLWGRAGCGACDWAKAGYAEPCKECPGLDD